MKLTAFLLISTAILSSSAFAADDLDYSVSEEHCTPEYWEKLPDDSKTDALIDKCEDLEPSE
ncbi:hypothetical protein [Pseudomonas sp. LFS044]|uniref:hypothetical protein n=1 Tax=Pseudomonas sp. LFS044 TaxID=3229880 RepID=UPI003A805634